MAKAVIIDLCRFGANSWNKATQDSLRQTLEVVEENALHTTLVYLVCCRRVQTERKNEDLFHTQLQSFHGPKKGCEIVCAQSTVAALYSIKQKLDEKDISRVEIILPSQDKPSIREFIGQLFTSVYQFEFKDLQVNGGENHLKKSAECELVSLTHQDVETIQSEIKIYLENLPSLKGELTILKSLLIPDHVFRHGFTTRAGGISYIPSLSSLNLFSSSKRRDPPIVVKENLRRLAIAAGFDQNAYHTIKTTNDFSKFEFVLIGEPEDEITIQMLSEKLWGEDALLSSLTVTCSTLGCGALMKVNHANEVWVMGKTKPDSYDGIVTNQKGVTIAAPGADCIPVLFADPVKKVCGAAHSGWHGTLLGVSMAVVNAMRIEYGSDVKDICVVLGPSVGLCCFTLPQESAKKFHMIDPKCVRGYGSSRPYVDIRRATRVLLETGGILPQNIQDDSIMDQNQNLTLCTSCHPDKFYSHVRDGENFGTQIGFISIKE